MLVEARVARPGIYLYRNADGSMRRELIPADVLFDVDSLGTLGRVGVTLDHPDVAVDEDNASQLVVGDVDGEVIEEPTAQGGFVRVKLAIRRRDALDAIEGGTVEVSPGYAVEVDMTPGEDPTYGRYDSRQVKRGPYNHVAIVERARGGSDVRLVLDGAEMVEPPETGEIGPAEPSSEEIEMEPVPPEIMDRCKGMGMDLAPDAGYPVIVDALMSMCDAMKAKMDGMMPKVEVVADKASPALLATVADLVPLVTRAQTLGIKLDGLDVPGLRRAVALKVAPTARKDGTDDFYAGILAVDAEIADLPPVLPAPRDSAPAPIRLDRIGDTTSHTMGS